MSWGEVYALSCAVAWSVAIILFRKAGDSLTPTVMNLFKTAVGFVLMVPTLWLVEGQWFVETQVDHFFILVLSGVMGIGIADALVLKSLSLIGATRWAIVECLYSPFIIALSLLFLGESFGWLEGIGTSMVLSAILCVTSTESARQRDRRAIGIGALYGSLGILSMAIGILLVKPVFEHVPLLWVVEVRLLAGILGATVSVLVAGGRSRDFLSVFSMKRPVVVLAASILSTYLAMILWVAGFKYNQASVAAVLNQTATIFTVGLAVVFLREKLTWRKVLGVLLAAGGVIVMTVDWVTLVSD